MEITENPLGSLCGLSTFQMTMILLGLLLWEELPPSHLVHTTHTSACSGAF